MQTARKNDLEDNRDGDYVRSRVCLLNLQMHMRFYWIGLKVDRVIGLEGLGLL